MKIKFLSLLILILSILFSFSVQSQNLVLKQNHANGIYKKGDQIQISAIGVKSITDSLLVKVWKNNNQLLLKSAILPSADSVVIFERILKEPCSIRIDASFQANKQSIGSIIDSRKIKTETSFPKDFYDYWNSEKQQQKALLMEVKTKKVEQTEPGYTCFDTEINCTGPKPARGYFAKPDKAAVRSLPIVLLVHAAGVKGSWCRSESSDALRYAKMGNGALCFDLNAHGMLNGQPDEYYNNLEAGELKDYFRIGMENRDEFYFRGMYLRLLRTIEFLTRQPEWDKKRIIVIGESQGGGQALAAAGLDSRVSAVVATVPAMCDWGGTLVERKGGWPQPYESKGNLAKMKQVLPYFDAANLLKKSKATIVVEIGLIDQTCPSTSVYAAINEAKGKKIIYPVTYREHSWPNETQRKEWDKMVFGPKNEFVENYLK